VVFTLFVGGELAPQVVGLLVLWVLEIVLSVCARLPDINDGAWDTLLGVEILDHAVHERSLAIWMGVANDGVTEIAEGGMRRPEGTENCGRGRYFARLVDVLVRNLVD
jgi:hypothetical protein